jgi:hypothetical protein
MEKPPMSNLYQIRVLGEREVLGMERKNGIPGWNRYE